MFPPDLQLFFLKSRSCSFDKVIFIITFYVSVFYVSNFANTCTQKVFFLLKVLGWVFWGLVV